MIDSHHYHAAQEGKGGAFFSILFKSS